MNSKVYYGDMMNLFDSVSDKSIQMVFADLPQAITKNHWDITIDLKEFWRHCERVICENGVVIIMANQPYTSEVVMSNIKMFKYSMVYNKTSPTNYLNAKKQPLRDHEDILIFYKKQPDYFPQKTTGHTRKVSTAQHKRNSIKTTNYNEHGLTTYDSTERYPKSVLRFKSDKQKGSLNATQKPVALVEWFIKSFTREGDVVLDPCVGSGTTIEACENTGRIGIGFEKDLNEFEKCMKRLSKQQ